MPETRKGRRRAAVTAAATAAIAPMAVPAIAPDSAAASPPPYCGSNTVCVYKGPNFSQSIGYLSPNVGDTNLADNRFVDGSTMNDNISAIWNNSNKWAHFCQNPTCGTNGWNFCLAPGVASGNLILYDNQISSWAPNSSGPTPCSHAIYGPQGCSI
jgi:hypothetical protein